MNALNPGRYHIQWKDNQGELQSRHCVVNDLGKYRWCKDGWAYDPSANWLRIDVAMELGATFTRAELPIAAATERRVESPATSLQETISWIDPIVEMPDADITVMLCLEKSDGSRETWPGLWTGEEWECADRHSLSDCIIVAWADMLIGPKVVRSEQTPTAEAVTNG